MYSQNDEEKYITEYFHNFNNGRGGKFIEIGAFHPTTFSNTRALFERGWTGVMVEPSPTCMANIKAVYANEPRIQLLQVAITHEDGYTKFYESGGDAVGTTEVQHKEKWEKGSNVQFSEIQVQTMSMAKLIALYGADVDFINIDVESNNLMLFNLLPNDFLHRLKMICIEHDGYHQSIIQKLTSFGFKQLLLNNENLIMVK